jgi:hypothetical protein
LRLRRSEKTRAAARAEARRRSQVGPVEEGPDEEARDGGGEGAEAEEEEESGGAELITCRPEAGEGKRGWKTGDERCIEPNLLGEGSNGCGRIMVAGFALKCGW